MTTETTSDRVSAFAQTPTSRRAFLRAASFTAVSAGALAACGKAAAAPDRPAAAAPPAGPAMHAAPAAVPSPRATADVMDAMHEKGMKAFPAKTAVHGNQPLAPTL